MRSVQRFIVAILAMGIGGCMTYEPTITPPESTYTRVRAAVIVNGASEMADVAHVSPEFFKTEGLQPLLGRFFHEGDYRTGGAAVAVLSHPYWTDRFRAEPAVLGSQVLVDGKRTVIVGVATPRLQPAKPASLWIPRTGPM